MNLLIYSLFPALLLLLYSGLVTTWIHLAHRPDGHIEDVANRFGWVMLALYLVWIALISIWQSQLPIQTIGQLAAFLGFLVWAGQSYVHTRIRQRLLAILPVGAVIALIFIALVGGVQPTNTPKAVQGLGAAFHISLSMAGVAMLLGSGVYGTGALILHRQLAHRTFGPFFSSLPSLEDMNRLRSIAIYVGWLLITVSLASAIVWTAIFRPGTDLIVSHLHPMLLLWAIVSLLAMSARFNWLRQHRLSWLSVLLAALVLILVLVSVIEFFAGAWL